MGLAAAACGGDGGSGPSGIARADLLALARIDSAHPPATTIRTLNNGQLATIRIVHSDPTQTLFAEFQFPPRSVVFANGTAVCDSCNYTVTLSVAPFASGYGFTLAPQDLVLRLSSSPTVMVQYVTFGDLSVYSQSPRYADAAAFDQALAVWFERTPGRWVEIRNSAHTGASTIASGIDGRGNYLIAALK